MHARLRGVTPRARRVRAARRDPGQAAPGGPGRTGRRGGRPPRVPPPGALRLVDGVLLVGTADEPLVLREVQPAGKKAMDAAAWARGLGPLDGKVLA
ncbi:hypothetical protein [Curtobacterium sp. MCJR17_043]|uniref:hypothetical protein n=1 Tax=Curtobacterium sp. MCJR17_043 TaxID=2175660 RepID=UPI0032E8FBE1